MSKKIFVNSKYISTYVNRELKELGIKMQVDEVYRTRYTPQQYEEGASKINIRLLHINNPSHLLATTVLCFYSMKELTEYLNNGYQLRLKIPSTVNTELDIEKIPS